MATLNKCIDDNNVANRHFEGLIQENSADEFIIQGDALIYSFDKRIFTLILPFKIAGVQTVNCNAAVYYQ